MVPIAQAKRSERPEHIRDNVEVVERAIDLDWSVSSLL